jgi:P27 family predicted phage terminase small subunit
LSNLAQAVDRAVDLPRIERWIEMSDEFEKVNAILKQTRLVKGSVGQPTPNPLVGYLSVLLAELRAAETELGMTPLARQRLGIAYGQARLTAQDLNRMLRERPERERGRGRRSGKRRDQERPHPPARFPGCRSRQTPLGPLEGRPLRDRLVDLVLPLPGPPGNSAPESAVSAISRSA